MFLQWSKTLDSGIGDLTNLFRVEMMPSLAMKLQVKALQMLLVTEIDESITNIAFVSEINRQIQEIVLSIVRLIKRVTQHLLSILVRDVLDHQASSIVYSQLFDTHFKLRSLFLSVMSLLDTSLPWLHDNLIVFLLVRIIFLGHLSRRVFIPGLFDWVSLHWQVCINFPERLLLAGLFLSKNSLLAHFTRLRLLWVFGLFDLVLNFRLGLWWLVELVCWRHLFWIKVTKRSFAWDSRLL